VVPGFAIALLAHPAVSEPERFGLGTPASAEDIRRIDIDVMPDGRGLPEGGGTAKRGAEIYAAACAHCHGEAGHGGPNGSLAGEPLHSASELAADRSLTRTVGNYWPFATTLFDYIRRAMPYDRPGSLSDDEVYAVTAYVLYLNDLTGEDTRIDARTLPAISMPARERFTPASAWERQP